MMGLYPARLCVAQAEDPHVHYFRRLLIERSNAIDRWEHEAELQVSFTLAVIIFGALVAILHGSRRGWCKAATISLGAATSILTGVNARAFPSDYRTLERSAVTARKIIRELNVRLTEFDPHQSPENIRSFDEEFLKKLNSIDDIEEKLYATASGEFWTITAYAQSLTPDWYGNLPTEARSLYFAGEATDSSLSAAKAKSFADAVQKTLKYVSDQIGSREPDFYDFIARSATVADTFFAYDRDKRSYTYYTLIRVSKELISVTKSLSATPHIPQLPKNTQPLSIVKDVEAFGFDRDGSYAAVAHRDGSAEVLKLPRPSGSEKRVYCKSPILAVEIDATGKRLLALTRDAILQAFTISTGKPLSVVRRLNGPGPVANAAFSPTGGLALTTFVDVYWPQGRERWLAPGSGSTELWRIPSGDHLYGGTDLKWIAFDWRDKCIAALRRNGDVIIVNSEPGKKKTAIHLKEPVRDMSFLNDKDKIILATGARHVFVYDIETGQPAETLAFESKIDLVAANPDGSSIAAAPPKGAIYLRHLSSSTTLELRTHNTRMKSIDFSPNGRWLAVLTEASELELYAMRSEDNQN